MKKIMFLMFMLFINICSVFSLTYGGCEYSDISRIKSLVSNINVYYDYHIVDNQAYFDVTMVNVPDNIYIYDVNNGRYYYNYDIVDGKITIYNYSGVSGSYKFYSALSECYGISLGTRYYNFPVYNIYHNNELCYDIPNFHACQKWVKDSYSYNEFRNLVYEYKNTAIIEIEEQETVKYEKSIIDEIAVFYVNYYYYILIGIILICGCIILISRRKNRFKL